MPSVSNSEPANTTPQNIQYKEISVSHKTSYPIIAERILLAKNEEDELLIKVNYSQCRRPELGDKFSSRHGQKGVCGLISPQEDMPFNDLGVVPDLIMQVFCLVPM